MRTTEPTKGRVLELSGSSDDELSKFYFNNCPTTVNFLCELDRTDVEPGRKQYPPLIFADFTETDGGSRGVLAVQHHGVFQRYTPATIAEIFSYHQDLHPAYELEKLRSLQSQIDDLDSAMSEWSLDKATQAFHAQRYKIADGKTGPTRSREEIQADYRQQLQAIEIKIAPLTNQAVDAAIPVIERARTVVIILMLDIEASERDQAKRYSLPWVPSTLFRACAAILVHWSGQTRSRLRLLRSPRSMLERIVQL
jgi:hypothetical protein